MAARRGATRRGIDWCCRSNPSLALAADGRLLLAYESAGHLWLRSSTDNGVSWGSERKLPTDTFGEASPAVWTSPDGGVWLAWHGLRERQMGDVVVVETGLFFQSSSDGGQTWTASAVLAPGGATPAGMAAGEGDQLVVYTNDSGGLYQRSMRGAAGWSDEKAIAPCCHGDPAVAVQGGAAWLAYEKSDGDIWYRTSADGGATWSSESRYTRFAGMDRAVAVAALSGGRAGFAWQSDRSGNSDAWFGVPGEREDVRPPPYVVWDNRLPACNLTSDTPITVQAYVLDETGLAKVELVWTLDDKGQPAAPMFDDGGHDDGGPGDNAWGVRFGPLPAGSRINYSVRATDVDGNAYLSPPASATVLMPFAKTSDLLLVPDAPGAPPGAFTSYYTAALDAFGFTYDVWDPAARCLPDGAILAQYASGAVIWAQADYIDAGAVPALLSAYLDAGGRLFLTGQNVGEVLAWNGQDQFLRDYLHARFLGSDSGLFALSGVDGSPVGSGLRLSIAGGDGANNQNSKDEIEPIAPARAAFLYRTTGSASLAGAAAPVAPGPSLAATPASPEPAPTLAPAPTMAPEPTPIATVVPPTPPACAGACGAGLTVDTGRYKLVYFAFGFEAIDQAAHRAEVMGRVMGWLGGQLLLLAPAQDEVLPVGSVVFSWSSVDAPSYEIQIDRVPTFDSPELTAATVPSIQYRGTVGEPGKHFWRVRATGGEWAAPRSFFVQLPVVPVTANPADDTAPALVQAGDKLLAVFGRDGALFSRVSSEAERVWSDEQEIAPCCRYNPSLTRASDGKLWLAYEREREIWLRASRDGGGSWDAEQRIDTGGAEAYSPALVPAADGRLGVFWRGSSADSPRAIRYSSSADGVGWTPPAALPDPVWEDDAPSAAATEGGRLIVVWQRYDGLWQRSTTDGGATWSEARQITSRWGDRDPALAARGNALWLVYEREAEIYFRTSTDGGETWPGERVFTHFTGPDRTPAVAALASGGLGIAWQSDRDGNPDIWYGSPGAMDDLTPPPYVFEIEHRPAPNPGADDVITFRARAADEAGLASVRLEWTLDGVPQSPLSMFDDEAHGDDGTRDGTWGVTHAPLPAGSVVTYRVRAVGAGGSSYVYESQKSLTVLPAFVKTAATLLVLDAGGTNAPNDTGWFRPYYTLALDAAGYRFDLWDTELRGEPSAELLRRYQKGAVIWATPFWGYLTSWDTGAAGRLEGYLAGGGRLFITGQNIGQSLSWSSLLGNYLHATFKQGDTGVYALGGKLGDPIGGGLALDLSGSDGANDQYSTDEIDPIEPAQVIFSYRSGGSDTPEAAGPAGAPADESSPQANVGSGTAGLRVETDVYKAVYFAFGFEGINDARQRQEVMRRVLEWLDVEPGVRVYLPLIRR